jgi:hypothetical protein
VITGALTGISLDHAPGTVVNSGAVISNATGTTGAGVYLRGGGIVSNGAPGGTTALITSSHTGVSFKNTTGTLLNFGSVVSTAIGTSGVEVYFDAGEVVINKGLITGAVSAPAVGAVTSHPGVVDARNQAATVDNLGVIASPANGSNGVNLLAGASVLNGAVASTAATITGSQTGIYMGGTLGVPTSGAIGSVNNYGLIQGTNGNGVVLASGGSVTNAAGGVIKGAITWIAIENAAGTVTNSGSITSTATRTTGPPVSTWEATAS